MGAINKAATIRKTDPAFWTYSEEELLAMGYLAPKNMPDGSQAALMPLIYTVAIVHGIHSYGYENRWCYNCTDKTLSPKEQALHTLTKALKALEQWEGEGEPQGWNRHPASGRRVDENGKITINY